MTFSKFKIISKESNPRGFGGKIYLHKSGEKICKTGKELKNFMLETFYVSPSLLRELDYFNAIFWANENNSEIIDFFGYSGLKDNWKGNPEIHSWVIRNGVWRYDNNITCGEGLILLGEEEKFRRRTKNIEEYLSKNLDLEKLNKLLKRR